jgi:hypothetical protein
VRKNTPIMIWIDEQPKADPRLAQEVAETLNEMRLEQDRETIGLSHAPRFIETVNCACASYLEECGIPFEEMRRRRALARRATRRPRRA